MTRVGFFCLLSVIYPAFYYTYWQISLPLSTGISLKNNTFKSKLETHLLKITSLKNSQFCSFILNFLFCQGRNTADKTLEHLLAHFPVRMIQFVQKWQVPQFILQLPTLFNIQSLMSAQLSKADTCFCSLRQRNIPAISTASFPWVFQNSSK